MKKSPNGKITRAVRHLQPDRCARHPRHTLLYSYLHVEEKRGASHHRQQIIWVSYGKVSEPESPAGFQTLYGQVSQAPNTGQYREKHWYLQANMSQSKHWDLQTTMS